MKTQQFALYDAERKVNMGRRFQTHLEVQSYLDLMTQTRWWMNDHPDVRDIECASSRRRGTSVGKWYSQDRAGYIEMAPDHLVENIVLHEVAHVVSHAEDCSNSHDPAFAQAYLVLVFRQRGLEAWTDLRDTFLSYEIIFNERDES